jgi:site-specific recombinase XerD
LTKGRGIHTLRHCFATHQLYQGTDIFVLQRLLGHSDIKTTIKYLHLTPERIASLKSPLDL